MNLLKKYTQKQLSVLTLKEITDVNNQFCKELDIKPTKRFASKSAATSRTILNQSKYLKQIKADVKKINNKPTKSTIDMNAKVSVVKGNPKPGSIESSIVTAINDELCSTVQEIVDYIVTNHKRPRSSLNVDTQYAIHNIRWFANNGHLKLGK